MIPHEAISCDANPSPVVGLGQNYLDHGVVGGRSDSGSRLTWQLST